MNEIISNNSGCDGHGHAPLLSGLRVLDSRATCPGRSPRACWLTWAPPSSRWSRLRATGATAGGAVRGAQPRQGLPHHRFRSSADLDRLRAWVQEADVLLDSFRPGVLQGLGLDAATLHALNPRLVMVSITGYGQHGPGRRRRGTT